MNVTEQEFREAVDEAYGLVEPYIVGAKKVPIRVVTLRRIVEGLKLGYKLP
jgi:hypothetical protein